MRAVFFETHGEVSVLQYAEFPTPSAGAGQVLVRIRACALNHLDIWVRKGWPALRLPLPHILGSDIAGVVAEIGPGVHGIEIGDEVIVSPGISCGRCEWCLSGFDNNCPAYQVIGEHIRGGNAEYLAVPAVNIIPKPKNLSFVEAAAFPLTFLTSWHMLVTRAKVRPGELVLVLAAGSGIGVAAMQIARLFGANVIAAAGSDEKLDKAQKLGAKYLINYHREDFLRKVREITADRGVDIVFEHIGKQTWDKSIKALARGGRVVVCGASSGYEAVTDLRYLFSRNLQIYGNFMGAKSELVRITQLVAENRLHPVVDRVFALEDAREAHVALENRSQFGKIVLRVDE